MIGEAADNALAPAPVTMIERAFTYVAAAGLFAMAAIVSVNVVTRWVSRALVPDDVQIIQELMVIVILLPLCWVTAQRGHIAVDVLTALMPVRARRRLAVVDHAAGLLFVGILLYAAWAGLAKAWQTQDYYDGVLDIPMWIGHAAFVFGLSGFLLRLVAMLLRDIGTAFGRG